MIAPVVGAGVVLQKCDRYLRDTNTKIVAAMHSVPLNTFKNLVLEEFTDPDEAKNFTFELFANTFRRLRDRSDVYTYFGDRNIIAKQVFETRCERLASNHIELMRLYPNVSLELRNDLNANTLSIALIEKIGELVVSMAQNHLEPTSGLPPFDPYEQQFFAAVSNFNQPSLLGSGPEGDIRCLHMQAMLTSYLKGEMSSKMPFLFQETEKRYLVGQLFPDAVERVRELCDLSLHQLYAMPLEAFNREGDNVRSDFHDFMTAIDAMYFMRIVNPKCASGIFASLYLIRDMLQQYADKCDVTKPNAILALNKNEVVYTYALMEYVIITYLKDVPILRDFYEKPIGAREVELNKIHAQARVGMWILCFQFFMVARVVAGDNAHVPLVWHVHEFIHSRAFQPNAIEKSDLAVGMFADERYRRDFAKRLSKKICVFGSALYPAFISWINVLESVYENKVPSELRLPRGNNTSISQALRQGKINSTHVVENPDDTNEYKGIYSFTTNLLALETVNPGSFVVDGLFSLLADYYEPRLPDGPPTIYNLIAEVWHDFAREVSLPRDGTFCRFEVEADDPLFAPALKANRYANADILYAPDDQVGVYAPVPDIPVPANPYQDDAPNELSREEKRKIKKAKSDKIRNRGTVSGVLSSNFQVKTIVGNGWKVTPAYQNDPNEGVWLVAEQKRRNAEWKRVSSLEPRYEGSTKKKDQIKVQAIRIYPWARVLRFESKTIVVSVAHNFSFWREGVACGFKGVQFFLPEVYTNTERVKRYIIDYAAAFNTTNPYGIERAKSSGIKQAAKITIEDAVTAMLTALRGTYFDTGNVTNPANPFHVNGLLMVMLTDNNDTNIVLRELARFIVSNEVTQNFHLLLICRRALRSVYCANLLQMLFELKRDGEDPMPVFPKSSGTSLNRKVVATITGMMDAYNRDIKVSNIADLEASMELVEILNKYRNYVKAVEEARCNEIVQACKTYFPEFVTELSFRLGYNPPSIPFLVPRETSFMLGLEDAGLDNGLPEGEDDEAAAEAVVEAAAAAAAEEEEEKVSVAGLLAKIPATIYVEQVRGSQVATPDLCKIAVLSFEKHIAYSGHLQSMNTNLFGLRFIPASVIETLVHALTSFNDRLRQRLADNQLYVDEKEELDRRVYHDAAITMYCEENTVYNNLLTLLRARIVADMTPDVTCLFEKMCKLASDKIDEGVGSDTMLILLSAVKWEAEWLLFCRQAEERYYGGVAFWKELLIAIRPQSMGPTEKHIEDAKKLGSSPDEIKTEFERLSPIIAEEMRSYYKTELQRNGIVIPPDPAAEEEEAASYIHPELDPFDPMSIDILQMVPVFNDDDNLEELEVPSSAVQWPDMTPTVPVMSDDALKQLNMFECKRFLSRHGTVSDVVYGFLMFRKWVGIAMPPMVFALLKNVRDNVEAKLERTPYFRWVAATLIVGGEKEKSKYENKQLASIAGDPEFIAVVEELSRRYTDQNEWRETIRTSKYTTLVTEIRLRRVATPRDIPFELSSTMVYSGLPASTPQNLGAAWWEEGIKRIRNRDPSIPVHIYVYAISMIHKLDRVHGNEDVYIHVKRVVGYVYNITGPHARGEMDKLPAKTIAYLFDQIVATKQINIEEWDEQTWKSDYKSIEQHLKSASDPSVDEKKLIDDISKNVGYLDMYIIATGKVDNVSNEIRYGKVTNLRYAVGYFYITSCWVDILTSFDRLVKLQKDPNRAERLAYEARDSAWQHERGVDSVRSNNDAISMLTSPSQPPGTRPPAAAAATTTTTTTTVPGLGRRPPPPTRMVPSSAATATGLRPPPTSMVPPSAATVFGLGRQLPPPTETQGRGANVPSPAATQMSQMFGYGSPGITSTPQQVSASITPLPTFPQNPRARGMSGFVPMPDI